MHRKLFFVAFIGIVALALWLTFFTLPVFNIKSIEISGNENLSKEQIDEWVKNVANQMLGIVEIILGAIEEGNIQYYSAKEFDEDIFNTIYYNILSEVEESIKFKTEG